MATEVARTFYGLKDAFGSKRQPEVKFALETSARMIKSLYGEFIEATACALQAELSVLFDRLTKIGVSGQLFPVFNESDTSNTALLNLTELARHYKTEYAFVERWWDEEVLTRSGDDSHPTIGAGLLISTPRSLSRRSVTDLRRLFHDEIPEGFYLDQLNLRDFLTILWMKRIEGIKPKGRRFPLGGGIVHLNEAEHSGRTGIASFEGERLYLTSRKSTTVPSDERAFLVLKTYA